MNTDWIVVSSCNESSLFAGTDGESAAKTKQCQSSVAPHIREELLLKL